MYTHTHIHTNVLVGRVCLLLFMFTNDVGRGGELTLWSYPEKILTKLEKLNLSAPEEFEVVVSCFKVFGNTVSRDVYTANDTTYTFG